MYILCEVDLSELEPQLYKWFYKQLRVRVKDCFSLGVSILELET